MYVVQLQNNLDATTYKKNVSTIMNNTLRYTTSKSTKRIEQTYTHDKPTWNVGVRYGDLMIGDTTLRPTRLMKSKGMTTSNVAEMYR